MSRSPEGEDGYGSQGLVVVELSVVVVERGAVVVVRSAVVVGPWAVVVVVPLWPGVVVLTVLTVVVVPIPGVTVNEPAAVAP